MNSPFAQEVRTKESILSSLSHNDPIQPLDFTLRSRYKTISISLAKGPTGTEDFFDISREFGILHGPFYLAPFSSPALVLLFPFSRLARRISLQSSRPELTRLLLDNTNVSRTNESPISRSYYYCSSFTFFMFSIWLLRFARLRQKSWQLITRRWGLTNEI